MVESVHKVKIVLYFFFFVKKIIEGKLWNCKLNTKKRGLWSPLIRGRYIFFSFKIMDSPLHPSPMPFKASSRASANEEAKRTTRFMTRYELARIIGTL